VPLRPGDKVDRYTIVALLGSGGMGEVYHAFDARLERQVALKVLRAEVGTETRRDASAEMLREARAAAALEHPNVVAVYDVAEAGAPESLRGATYLTMELIEGRTLRDVVGDGSIPIALRIEWLASVARALDAAHRRGLVHRDVKPGNVMIRSDGAVKVLDFGIAKRLRRPVDRNAATEGTGDAMTMTTTGGGSVGTPAYMAPEQIRNEPLDGRCDQFAWGVMAYELLCGRRPWRSDGDALHLVAEVLSFEPPAPSSVAADVPPLVSAVVKRALEKGAANRFATMSELVTALEGRSEDAASRPYAATAPEPATRSASSFPVAPRPPSRPAGPVSPRILASVLVGTVVVTVVVLGARKGAAPSSAARAGASPRECTTSAQCVDAHAGAAWTCRAHDGRCAPLASEDCEVLAEPSDLRDVGTVWIGAMSSGDLATRNSVELARRDFAAVPRTLAGAPSRRRPIAVISCDDSKEPRRALRHLLDEVGVPAVIGFRSSEEALDLLSEDLVPRGVMSVVAMNPAAQIGAIASPAGSPRLVWRTTNDTTQMAGAASTFAQHILEPRATAGARARPFKVALLRPGTITGVAFSDAIVSSLRLNGKSVADNQLNFAELVFDPGVGTLDAQVTAAARTLEALRPDAVIYVGGELFELVLQPLERTWPAALPRPTYVSGLPFDDGVLRGVSEGLHGRMFAVTTPTNTPANTKFTLHYNATFADKVTPSNSPNTTYDAFYVIAYSLSALGDGRVDGASLAGQIGRLVSGSKVEVGPAKILQTLGILAAGGGIDLEGAASALDFDLGTGESRPDHVILCLGRGLDGARVGVESGVTWDAKTGALGGRLACP
jgi:serine/threonine protein kinase/ABC-type branched-subunit amino acid transport system substrate-binding protein